MKDKDTGPTAFLWLTYDLGSEPVSCVKKKRICGVYDGVWQVIIWSDLKTLRTTDLCRLQQKVIPFWV